MARHKSPGNRHHRSQLQEVLRRRAAGETLKAICRDPHMPCRSTVYNWLAQQPSTEMPSPDDAVPATVADLPRPTGYNDAVAEAICMQLSLGHSLHEICREEAMPGRATVLGWLDHNPLFHKRYTAARLRQAHALVDEMLALSRSDVSPAEKSARAAILKWAAARLHPNRYGDRPVTVDALPTGPVFTVVTRASNDSGSSAEDGIDG